MDEKTERKERIQNLLKEYLEEKEKLESQVTQNGNPPEELCDICKAKKWKIDGLRERVTVYRGEYLTQKELRETLREAEEKNREKRIEIEGVERESCPLLRKEEMSPLYDSRECFWKGTLLFKKFDEENIKIKALKEISDFHSTTPKDLVFFLPEYKTLISPNPRSIGTEIRRTHSGWDDFYTQLMEKLGVKLWVYFAHYRKEILGLTDFDVNILLVIPPEKKFIYYDKEADMEKSEAKIVEEIIKKVDDYRKSETGKEHTRLKEALKRIGSELGYIPEDEHSVSGLKVDVVWHSRKGEKVKVAFEIETTGGWKKDLISTWETDPDLAVLVTTNLKTDDKVKDLLKLKIIRRMPHKFLYINLKTGNAFLLDDAGIKGKYSLGEGKVEEEKGWETESI